MKSRKRMQGDEGPRKERHEAVLHTTEVLVRIKKERSQEMVSDGARLANLEACRQLERRLYLSVPVPRQTGIVFHFHSVMIQSGASEDLVGPDGYPAMCPKMSTPAGRRGACRTHCCLRF